MKLASGGLWGCQAEMGQGILPPKLETGTQARLHEVARSCTKVCTKFGGPNQLFSHVIRCKTGHRAKLHEVGTKLQGTREGSPTIVLPDTKTRADEADLGAVGWSLWCFAGFGRVWRDFGWIWRI